MARSCALTFLKLITRTMTLSFFSTSRAADQPGGGGQIVVVIGHHHEIGPVVGDHHRLLGKNAFDFLGEIRGRQVVEGKNLDQTLAAAGNRRVRRPRQFGTRFIFDSWSAGTMRMELLVSMAVKPSMPSAR